MKVLLFDIITHKIKVKLLEMHANHAVRGLFLVVIQEDLIKGVNRSKVKDFAQHPILDHSRQSIDKPACYKSKDDYELGALCLFEE